MMRYEQEFIESLRSVRDNVRLRMIGRGEDWEDVYGDAVVAGLKFVKEGKFRNGSSMKTLLIGIALNKVRDYYRTQKRLYDGMKKFTYEVPLATHENHLETTLPSYLAILVHRLPSKQRRVILFYLYESDNLADLARELDARQETARSWFHRAKKKLHSELSEPAPRPVRKIEREREALELIPKGKREQLKWLIRMHNAYVCVCRMNNGHPGTEQMIEDSTEARNGIAETLICGRQIDKLLDDMSDADTISYLIANKSL